MSNYTDWVGISERNKFTIFCNVHKHQWQTDSIAFLDVFFLIETNIVNTGQSSALLICSSGHAIVMSNVYYGALLLLSH